MSLCLLIVTTKKYHYNCRWNSLILQCSEDLKLKFLACHILDFYKNYVFPFGWFGNLITFTQQVVSMFGTTYNCEQLFSKRKHTKITLHLQLSNHQLSNVILLSTFSIKLILNVFLWLQTSEILSIRSKTAKV